MCPSVAYTSGRRSGAAKIIRHPTQAGANDKARTLFCPLSLRPIVKPPLTDFFCLPCLQLTGEASSENRLALMASVSSDMGAVDPQSLSCAVDVTPGDKGGGPLASTVLIEQIKRAGAITEVVHLTLTRTRHNILLLIFDNTKEVSISVSQPRRYCFWFGCDDARRLECSCGPASAVFYQVPCHLVATGREMPLNAKRHM